MTKKTINIIMAASTLALIALVFLQAKWMLDSRKLIEEQFDQRVSLALCSAVKELEGSPACNNVRASCAVGTPSTCSVTLQNIFSTPEFAEALDEALAFYRVDIDYEIQVYHKTLLDNGLLPANCCALKPILATDDHYIQLNFPRKGAYFFKKMGFMTMASAIILLFICTVFIMANYAIIKQRRIMETNKDFFNSMAHEFRTPLTNISLALKMLTKRHAGLEDDKYIGIVKKENQQLMHQVGSVLDLAVLERGRYPLHKEMVDLPVLLQQVIDNLELQIQARRAKVRIHSDQASIPVSADPLHLSNSLKNLLDNALKHNTNTPEIDINIHTEDKGVRISVQDNGNGIAWEDRELIFDRYYRPAEASTQNRGFGIGLAYVKKIVELHQGSIEVISELDKGSRFSLFLPTT